MITRFGLETIGEFEIWSGERYGNAGWFYRHRTIHPGRDQDATLGGFVSTIEAARELAETFSNPVKCRE